MDDPALPVTEHHAALAGLRRLNAASSSARTVWRGLASLIDPGRAEPLTVLDAACGGGDVPVLVHGLALSRGLRIQWAVCDRSPTAVQVAERALRARGATVEGRVADALTGLPGSSCDVATCSLFAHHLDEPDVVALLRSLMGVARLGVVVYDLRRTRTGVVLAFAAARLLSRSRVVHTDAVRSARAAWTIPEVGEFARRAGMRGVRIVPACPIRWLLTWRVPPRGA